MATMNDLTDFIEFKRFMSDKYKDVDIKYDICDARLRIYTSWDGPCHDKRCLTMNVTEEILFPENKDLLELTIKDLEESIDYINSREVDKYNNYEETLKFDDNIEMKEQLFGKYKDDIIVKQNNNIIYLLYQKNDGQYICVERGVRMGKTPVDVLKWCENSLNTEIGEINND